MFRLVIDVPESLKDKAASRAAEAGYASVEAYLQDVVRDGIECDSLDAPSEQTIRSGVDVEAMIQKGIASGDAVDLTSADWDLKRKQLIDRHQQKAAQ